MIKENEDVELFAHKLALLGGRISYRDQSDIKYIDLEEFFLGATIHVFNDGRLANCIEHWIKRFGNLISPSKVRKLILQDYLFDKAVLGVFLDLIEETRSEKQINLSILREFTEKKESLISRNESKISVKEKWQDPLWLKYNINTYKFSPEFSKNLISTEVLLKRRPELRYRIIGCNILDSDIQSYFEVTGSIKSIRNLGQIIHGHYSNVHKVAKRLLKHGIITIDQPAGIIH